MPERPGIRYRTAQVRALPDVGEGVVEAYVTVYDVPYRVGFFGKEVIDPGAFDDSIAENSSLPIFWMHGWRDAGQIIGDGVASSDEKGIRVRSQLYMDSDGARNVWRGISAGSIREWSIGYYVKAWREDDDDEELEHVTEGELIEASSVVRGANPETETIEVRSGDGVVIPYAVFDSKTGQLVYRIDDDRRNTRKGRKDTTTSDDDPQSLDPDKLAADIVARLREREPALADDPALAEHLSEPWFRELVRERLSSSPPQSTE